MQGGFCCTERVPLLVTGTFVSVQSLPVAMLLAPSLASSTGCLCAKQLFLALHDSSREVRYDMPGI